MIDCVLSPFEGVLSVVCTDACVCRCFRKDNTGLFLAGDEALITKCFILALWRTVDPQNGATRLDSSSAGLGIGERLLVQIPRCLFDLGVFDGFPSFLIGFVSMPGRVVFGNEIEKVGSLVADGEPDCRHRGRFRLAFIESCNRSDDFSVVSVINNVIKLGDFG